MKNRAASKRQLSKCHIAHHNYTHSKGKRSSVISRFASSINATLCSHGKTQHAKLDLWGAAVAMKVERLPVACREDNPSTKTTRAQAWQKGVGETEWSRRKMALERRAEVQIPDPGGNVRLAICSLRKISSLSDLSHETRYRAKKKTDPNT